MAPCNDVSNVLNLRYLSWDINAFQWTDRRGDKIKYAKVAFKWNKFHDNLHDANINKTSN